MVKKIPIIDVKQILNVIQVAFSQCLLSLVQKKTRILLTVKKAASLICFLMITCDIDAATITSNNVVGDWNDPGTWIGGNVPGVNDDVILNANARITVTADASCASISWTGNIGATRILLINASVTLTVTGNILLGDHARNNANRTIEVEGTLFCNDFEMSATGANSRDIDLDIGTSGEVNILGNLIMPGNFARNHVDMSSGSVLNIGGNVGSDATATAGGGGFTSPPSGSVINLNGTVEQFFFPGNAADYDIFKINNTAGAYLQRNITVNTMTIGDEVPNSVFRDNGFNVLTTTTTLNLLNGSFYVLGQADDNSTFPSYTTYNVEEGTTFHYVCETVNQTVSTDLEYPNLILSGGTKQIAGGTLTVRNKLTLNTGATFNGNANDPILVLKGDFENNGTFTSGTSMCNFEGTQNQLISGSAEPFFNGGLTIANTGTQGNNTVTLNTNISVNNELTIESGVFDLSQYTADRSTAGGTLTVANDARLIIGDTNTLPSNYDTHVIGLTSNIEYAGTTTTVAALNSSQSYGNLIISGSGVTTNNNFAVAGTMTVSGSFTAGAGTVTMNNQSSGITNNGTLVFNDLLIDVTPLNQSQYNASYTVASNFEISSGVNFSPTGGTINMTGNAGQIINGSGTLNFSSLEISGDISSAGNFNVNSNMIVTGRFTPNANDVIGGSGTLDGTGDLFVTRISSVAGFAGQYTINNADLLDITVTYNGAGDQTITAENYWNLVVAENGTRTVTLIANETIGVAGQFTPDQNNTTYIVTDNTFNYNGTQNQLVTGFTYNTLVLSGTGNKTIQTGVEVNCSGLDIFDDIQLNIEGTAQLNFL
jgi:hypothetical protein